MAVQCNKGLSTRTAMVVPGGCAHGAGVDSREWQIKIQTPSVPQS